MLTTGCSTRRPVTLVKALRATTEKSAAEALLPKVTAMLDKLAKHNIVHKNKAANLKSAMQLHVNAL